MAAFDETASSFASVNLRNSNNHVFMSPVFLFLCFENRQKKKAIVNTGIWNLTNELD